MDWISSFLVKSTSLLQLSGFKSLYMTNFVKEKNPNATSSLTSHLLNGFIAFLTSARYWFTPSMYEVCSNLGSSMPASRNLAWIEMLFWMSSPVQDNEKEFPTFLRSIATGIRISGAKFFCLGFFLSIHSIKPRAIYKIL